MVDREALARAQRRASRGVERRRAERRRAERRADSLPDIDQDDANDFLELWRVVESEIERRGLEVTAGRYIVETVRARLGFAHTEPEEG